MYEKDEDNPYPSFHAACALAKRSKIPGVSFRVDMIKSKLGKFTGDPDVSDIPKNYLDGTGN